MSAEEPRALALTRRQQRLLLRIAQQRREAALAWQDLQPPLRLAERVRQAWQWLRAHPEWPLAAGVALVVLRPRRAWRWGLRAWWGWQHWQRLRRWLLQAGLS
ncbi:MAG: YqjK family protein [Rubrivivax sp.]